MYTGSLQRWKKRKVITMEVSCREGDISVSNDNLVMIASELHYIYFYVKQEGEYQKFSVRGKLDEFEKEFSCLGLLRVHKSFFDQSRLCGLYKTWICTNENR